MADVFLFPEPLGGWRRTAVPAQRARVDWAWQIRHPLEVDYPQAEKVILVRDNLNTHGIASLYEAFEPAVAAPLSPSGFGGWVDEQIEVLREAAPLLFAQWR